MLILGCYWVCLCHIIAGENTLHDIISAAADTTGGNNNNDTSKKQTVSGDDDMPFHWPPTLLNQQHRSFSSFSGQGVQIHTSKRKPDDPDFGVLVRILRSANTEKDTEPSSAAASAEDSNNNNNGNSRFVSPSSSTGRRRRALKKRETRRRQRNIISGDNENNGHNGRGLLENSAIDKGPLDQRQTILLRKPRSAAVITQDSDKIPLLALDANTNKRPSTLDQSASSSSATVPLQYIIVVVSVPACIVLLFVTLFSYSFFN